MSTELKTVAWLHKQGNFTDPQPRPLDDHEVSRGWTASELVDRSEAEEEIARLRAALRQTLEAMDMQEKRERGEFHIPSETALCIWRDAQKAARAALEARKQEAQPDTVRSTAYDMLDRHLRNSLGDSDYAEMSGALEALYGASKQEAQGGQVPEGTTIKSDEWDALSPEAQNRLTQITDNVRAKQATRRQNLIKTSDARQAMRNAPLFQKTMESTDTLYEELRAAVDDGDENMTHEGAIEQVRAMRDELNQVGAILSNAAGPWRLADGEPMVVRRLKLLILDHVAPEGFDDAAVAKFSMAMRDKLQKAREKGRGGWQECDAGVLSGMLREHVEKGDPIDVANFCMFLWSLGYGISAKGQSHA